MPMTRPVGISVRYRRQSKAYVDHLQDKNAPVLIPGCGHGYEAEYMLEQGFSDVTVVDIAALPLERLRSRVGDRSGLKTIQK